MSQRTDRRAQTKANLAVYTKATKLAEHIMSICKPKDKNVNNHHIPKKNVVIGKLLMEAAVELGADILEANDVYVGTNLEASARIDGYRERERLQKHGKRMLSRAEFILDVLHHDRPFAESTLSYAVDLLCETRELLNAWREADKKTARSLK